MQIYYYSEKLKKNYSDDSFLNKKFGQDVCKKFKEFIQILHVAENLSDVRALKPGMKIEKLKVKNNQWSVRLNKKYRVNFQCKNKEIQKIKSITILKIHAHNY